MAEQLIDLFIRGDETRLAVSFLIAIIGGFLIGAERESRAKPAGISTHILVIAGAMVFTYLSSEVDPNSTSRIAAYVVAGIGFLGGGMIIKSDIKNIFNLTTAASIWFAAAIGMAIGYQYYLLAILAIALNVLVPRIPHISKRDPTKQ